MKTPIPVAVVALAVSAVLQPIAAVASAVMALALVPTIGWQRASGLLVVLLVAAQLGVRVDAAPPAYRRGVDAS